MHFAPRLNPTLPLMPGESPASFASRLANIHGIGSAREFCLDMGFQFQGVVDGAEEALTALSELSGASLDSLRINAIRRAGGVFSIGTQRLNKASLRRERLHVCPLCLKDDIETSAVPAAFAVYGRTIWLLNHIRTCPLHHFPLVKVSENTLGRLHEFSFSIQQMWPDLEMIIPRFHERRRSELETYLLNRILGLKSRAEWLDNLEWFAAARTCEMIGVVVEFGRTPNLNSFTDDDWHRAGITGFDIAAGGEASVWSLLSDLQTSYNYKDAHEGPQAYFGRLFQWLAFGTQYPEYSPVRDLMRRHIIESSPVGPGDIILGKPVEKRVIHSVITASQESGAHPKRLRKLLVAAGIIPPGLDQYPSGRVLFNASSAEGFIARAVTSLNLKEVEAHLGVGRAQAKLLYQNGFILPCVPEGAEGLGDLAFARDDLDAFLRQLLEGAVPFSDPQPPICSIEKAVKRVNCSIAEIVQLILGKKLRWLGLDPAQHGFAALLVDVEEIKELVRGEYPGGVPIYVALEKLKTTERVAKLLIAGGHLITVAAISPLNRCPVRLIPNDSLEGFRDRYISLYELTLVTGYHHTKVKRLLDARGLEPALTSDRFGATFYFKSDVAYLAR
ncbi:MAG: TniQ family protein [Methylovirgula sp.]|uniref:TniQ family protein n=1 Tax=Methylovirgula sp. TaxID=1978224 RepID=UPI0030762C6B